MVELATQWDKSSIDPTIRRLAQKKAARRERESHQVRDNFICISKMQKQDHSAPGPTPSSMVPVVPLVHLDPPWSAISGVWLHEVDQAGSRWTRSGPGAPAGPWCRVVDQRRSGPPWSTKKHFPDAGVSKKTE